MTLIFIASAPLFFYAGWCFRGESDRINAHTQRILTEIDREREK